MNCGTTYLTFPLYYGKSRRFARLVYSWTVDLPGLISLGFKTIIFLQSKVVNLASNPQPGGPGPYIYILQ
jgi:hypothetical protein